MSSLGKTLKALRQKQALNQKALSALSGVSQATISRIETGRVRQLRSSALKNLADALGVSVDFLMGDHDIYAEIPGKQSSSSIPGVPGVREDRFRQIADTLDAFAVHEQGRVLYVNQSLADMLGYRKEELLGKNGIEMVIDPRSQAQAQRMVNNNSTEAYEVLIVRKDGSVFPAEVHGRNINDTVRLAVLRNITTQRCQQAVSRVQQAGLEIGRLADLDRVMRILADEVEDMGRHFEAVGLHVIDEEKDCITSFHSFPESRGYQSCADTRPLKESLSQHAALRGLISHWRRDKVWEREADASFFELVGETSLGTSYRPGLLVDVPFARGTLSMGLPAHQSMRMDETVSLLAALAQPVSLIVRRLQETERLVEELEEARRTSGKGASARA